MDKITQLWEIEQIKQLKARYFRLLDTKQWHEFRELFADDLVFRHDASGSNSRPLEGAKGFVEYVSVRALPSAATAHHGHMPEIEITSPTTARGIWAMFDWVDDAEHARAFKGYGHYHEDYEKDAAGRWRIKSLQLTRLRVDARPPTRPNEIRRVTPVV
jgi:hypothetical protein